MTDRCCYHCKTTKGEFRPYGPNSSLVCFKCAMDPKNIKETEKQFDKQINDSAQQSDIPIVFIGEETGPRPACPKVQ